MDGSMAQHLLSMQQVLGVLSRPGGGRGGGGEGGGGGGKESIRIEIYQNSKERGRPCCHTFCLWQFGQASRHHNDNEQVCGGEMAVKEK